MLLDGKFLCHFTYGMKSTNNVQSDSNSGNSEKTNHLSFEELKCKYSDIFKDKINNVIKHNITHSIQTMGRFVKPNIYPVANAYVEPVRKIFDDLLKNNIIRPSSSPIASPLVCIPKKDGTIRPCVDYRNINKITVPHRYSLPRINYIKEHIKGRVFSKIDLKDGFYQIPVSPEDIYKTAVSTPWGLFEYVRMPFGLTNSPPTFQRFMNLVTRGIKNIFTYIDDIIIFTDTEEEHLLILSQLFDRFREFGLTINITKSEFMKANINYLGFSFSSEGYTPLQSNLPKYWIFQYPNQKKIYINFWVLLISIVPIFLDFLILRPPYMILSVANTNLCGIKHLMSPLTN